MAISEKTKLFSILGDSVSTLEGYSVPEYAAFYDTPRKLQASIFVPKDTWWGQVISALNGELLVNNSFSGSTVCWNSRYEIPSYGCSEERTSCLGKEDLSPDVIMVFMGMNDWGKGVRVLPGVGEEHDLTVFSVAYRQMICQLKKNYPRAEVWCFTLPVSAYICAETYSFPYCYGGIHIEEYCNAICACAKEYGCRVIDLYGAVKSYDTIDDFHPSAHGMRTLAKATLEQL